ncbi:tyrosine-type recombinase/integrase [Clostridium tyrobutyricum]|uniref:tyrosine-type recombinase/integrase n=1 Tax=Clostridium tyrobutyricum TaxID=1519 RepID=UPI00057C86B4|nr:site-specific integrase [Clostridium tyrobutyricum]
MATKTNVIKNGIKYYRVWLELGRDSNGKRRQKEFYGRSKKEAENKRNEYMNGLKSGLNVDAKNVSLGELMYLWLFEVIRISKDIKATSFERYETIYRLYIKDSEIYGIKILDIKSINIQKYYNKLYENGKHSSLIFNINKLLRTFFNYAVNEGYIIKNPCSGKRITIPGQKENTSKKEVEVFSDKELKIFESAIDSHRLKALFLLAIGTGLRQGELLALKWSDIDFNNNILSVKRSIKNTSIMQSDGSKKRKTIIQVPKTKNSLRTVPIPSKLIPVIKRHELQKKEEKLKSGDTYTDSEFVFTTAMGLNIDARNLLRSYKRVLTKAKIPYRKFHALRHTYATKLFEKNIPLKTVQMLLGHADISTTADIYTHVMPEQKIKAVDKLNDLFI